MYTYVCMYIMSCEILILYDRFMGVPEWKKKLIVKKEVELARMQKVEEERLRVQKEEEARFNAMPDWKKRLVSQKRADVRF